MTNLPLLPLANLEIWLTPLWILSVGVTAGAALLALIYGLVWLISRPAAASLWATVQDGVLLQLSYVIAAFMLLFLIGAFTMPMSRLRESLQRLPAVGPATVTQEIKPKVEDQEVTVNFRADELQDYTFTSNQDLRIASEKGAAYIQPIAVVQGDEPYKWTPNSRLPRGFQDTVTKLYVTNEGDIPAAFAMEYATDVAMPEVHYVPIAAASVVGIFVLYFLVNWLLSGVSTIALATSKEAIAQPLFLLFLGGGALALLAYVYIPYNTFGEDVKMLKDSGLTTIMVLSIIFALWTASVSVADEIEGRTALTLLSKPISRRQFILGKFLGIIWPVLLMYVVLGAVLLATVSYKVVYDARETSNPNPDWQLCFDEMIRTVPGLVLAFFETVVLTAISVAISTRLPMLPNLLICGSIYVLGHLGPMIVNSSAGEIEFVAFIGKLVAVVLPVLDHFNIQAAIAGGQRVPWDYLGMAALYCALYSTVAMLLALALFEDRDLA